MVTSSPRVRFAHSIAAPFVHLSLVLVLSFVSSLVLNLAKVAPALAQPASGQVGIYFDPAGTVNEAWYFYGCPDCDNQYQWQDERGYGYTAYVVAKDLPGNLSHYSLVFELSQDFTVDPHFPEGSQFTSYLSVDESHGIQRISYEVTPADCLAANGSIVLMSLDLVFLYQPGSMVALMPESPDLGKVGYMPCSQEGSEFTPWSFATEAITFSPIIVEDWGPAATGSMGALKSWY